MGGLSFSWFRHRVSGANAATPDDTRPPLIPLAKKSARLALYHSWDTVPEVHIVSADDELSFIASLSQQAFEASRVRNGGVPFTALREIVENLLHASFVGAVVSVLPDGSVSVSDQGPGIADPATALRPGFSTASPELRRVMRGVGSGLTIAEETLRRAGGNLTIEANLGGGTVVTLQAGQNQHAAARSTQPGMPGIPSAETQTSQLPLLQDVSAQTGAPIATGLGEEATAPGLRTAEPAGHPTPENESTTGEKRREIGAEAPKISGALVDAPPSDAGDASKRGEYKRSRSGPKPAAKNSQTPATSGERVCLADVTPRQRRVLALLADIPEVGPSTAANEAGLSLASAYRDLVALERLGLAQPTSGGKRRLSEQGRTVLAELAKASEV